MNNMLRLQAGNDQFGAALRAFLPLSDAELAQMHHHAQMLDSILANMPETGYEAIPIIREVLTLLMAGIVGVQNIKKSGLTLADGLPDDSRGAPAATDARGWPQATGQDDGDGLGGPDCDGGIRK